MSSKLDKSLDEITGAQRKNASRGARRGGKPAVVAGGVSKRTATKPAKGTGARAPAVPVPQQRDSKIIVSNLPDDVNEQQIKEYFSSTVGPVKKVLLTYTKTGRSAGVATIIFVQPNSAAKAATDYNGVKVDGKPMRIEVVMGAQSVAAAPAPKTLSDRISGPKKVTAKPKAVGKAGAAAGTAAAANGAAAATKGGRAGRRTRGARPAKKTAEQLDADMADYFDVNAAAPAPAANGNATAAPVAAPNGGEATMEDEIL